MFYLGKNTFAELKLLHRACAAIPEPVHLPTSKLACTGRRFLVDTDYLKKCKKILGKIRVARQMSLTLSHVCQPIDVIIRLVTRFFVNSTPEKAHDKCCLF